MTIYEIYKSIDFLSPLALIIGVSVGAIFYKYLDNVHRSVSIYLGFMLLVDFTSRIYAYCFSNNHIILLLYSMLELILFLYFYLKYMLRKKYLAIICIGIAGILYILWELITFRENAKQFQPYSKIADNAMIIFLVLTFFSEKISNYSDSKWDYFKLNIAVLLFFTINLIFFLPLNFLINEETGAYFWIGIVIINMLFYLYLTSLIWQNAAASRKLKNKAA